MIPNQELGGVPVRCYKPKKPMSPIERLEYWNNIAREARRPKVKRNRVNLKELVKLLPQ